MIALKRVGEGLLVDDLTPGDIDEHAPRLHRSKAVLVEETGRLRCPLAADHHEIALRQEPIEIPGAAKLAESRWQGLGLGAGCGGCRRPACRGRRRVYRHRARFRRRPRRTQSYLPIEAVDMRDGRTRPRPDRPRRGGGPWQSAKYRPPRIPPSLAYCPNLVRLSPPRGWPIDRPRADCWRPQGADETISTSAP